MAKVNLDNSRFIRLLLSGNVVATTNYTVAAGSTVITLTEAYLRTFTNGTYRFRAEFTDQNVDLTLIVSTNFGRVPQTGVPDIMGTVIAMWFSIFITAALSIYLYSHIKSKRKRKDFSSQNGK